MNQPNGVNLISVISEEKLRAVIETQTCVATLGLDLNAVMAMAAERARSITNAIASSVELADGKHMAFRSISSNVSRSTWLRLSANTPFPGSYQASNKTQHSGNGKNSSCVHRIVLHKQGLCTILVLPLNHLDQPVAVLKLMSATPSGFSQGDMEILGLMSSLFSASIYNATRYGTSALFHQATTDELTGLPNRALFLDRLRRAHAIASREERRMGVLILDMDDLKSINDRYGHRAGDAAIQEMGQRIKAEIRSADTAARIGGDEFAVVLYAIEDRHAACSAVERINRRCKQPFIFEGKIMPLRVSIGMALYPEDSRELETLMDIADKQMYGHKRAKTSLTSDAYPPVPPFRDYHEKDRALSLQSPTGIQPEANQNW